MNSLRVTSSDTPNCLLAEILYLISIFTSKIEHSKEKLAGFTHFSVEGAFKSIDQHNRGSVFVEDLRVFLDEKIFSRDIHLLFQTQGSAQRLSFLGFLKLMRPHFNKKLAEDMLSRGQEGPMSPEVRSLLEEALTLMLVMIGQSESLRLKLAKEWCLNSQEIMGVLRGDSGRQQQTGVVEFMRANGYGDQDFDTKNIEAYLNARIDLEDDAQINYLFLPSQFESPPQPPSTRVSKGSSDELGSKTSYLKVRHPKAVALPYNSSRFKDPSQRQPQDRPPYELKTSLPTDNVDPRRQQNTQRGIVGNSQQNNMENVPILDMFLKNSSAPFYSSQREAEDFNQKSSSSRVFPKEEHGPRQQGSLSKAALTSQTHGKSKILDEFMKSGPEREVFHDEISSRSSESAIRYVQN